MRLPLPKRKFFVVAFLAAMALCNVSLPARLMPMLRNGYQDFTIFYTGARLLRDGKASMLYNLAAQYQMQQTFTNVAIREGALPFNHPPFEALFFVPFTMLSYWHAYLLWTVINSLMLAAVVAVLRRYFSQLSAISPLVMGLASIAFFPIAFGIVQGQDIVLLLLIFVLAIGWLDRGHDAAAGALLGAGLFRPQLVVPFVVLLAIRRWRVLAGFIPVGLILVGISVAIMGWGGPAAYTRFLFHLEGSEARAFTPAAVPNLRGIVGSLHGLGVSGWLSGVLIFVLSAVVFLLALRRMRDEQDSIIFSSSLAAVTAILVSFHALVYDLGLLLPTIFFLLAPALAERGDEIDGWAVVLLGLVFLAPLCVFLLHVVVFFSLILLWIYFRLLSTPALVEAPARA